MIWLQIKRQMIYNYNAFLLRAERRDFVMTQTELVLLLHEKIVELEKALQSSNVEKHEAKKD